MMSSNDIHHFIWILLTHGHFGLFLYLIDGSLTKTSMKLQVQMIIKLAQVIFVMFSTKHSSFCFDTTKIVVAMFSKTTGPINFCDAQMRCI